MNGLGAEHEGIEALVPASQQAWPQRDPVALRFRRGLRCLVAAMGIALSGPAAYYACLNMRPPTPRGGDLYFGDGTGFIIAAVLGVPALMLLLVAAIGLRREKQQDG